MSKQSELSAKLYEEDEESFKKTMMLADAVLGLFAGDTQISINLDNKYVIYPNRIVFDNGLALVLEIE